jgi:hypothetical protein
MKTDIGAQEWCESGYAERPRYYPRQLITPDDLTLGLEYLLKLQRRHNRLIHGWGVVCGAEVAPVIPANGTGAARPWKVIVRPGYILDPYGREILIDTEVCFDLRRRCVTGMTGEACGEKVDPWCSDVFVRPDDDGVLYVAVQYKQIQSRPVRVQPVGCGCDDTSCEFSRWRDAFEICTLDACPESHRHQERTESRDNATMVDLVKCPECPADPWVVLAEVRIDAEGEIQYIDNCSCRRIVRSFAHEWLRCRPLEMDPVQQPLTRGEPDQEIQIRGRELVREMRVLLPRGVKETADRKLTTAANETMVLTLTVAVDATAELGPQPILIVHPDGSTRRGTLTIEEKGEGQRVSPSVKSALRRPKRQDREE